MRWAVVVPSNRPDRLQVFKEAWQPLFDRHQVDLIVVHDNPETWAGLPEWVPRRSDMIRSWGFVQAYQSDADYVLTLDDDTLPVDDPLFAYEDQFRVGAPSSAYFSVGALTTSQLEMRGFPYRDRQPAQVAVQYGGWSGVLDYDAATQLAAPRGPEEFLPLPMPVPKGAAVTCCIMNCAFRREVTPIMWQLPMIDGRYNRWGDIWSGLLQKRALDAAGMAMVINGLASVRHERASDPIVNLEREQPGVAINEGLWAALSAAGDEPPDLLAAWVNAGHALADHIRKCGDAEWAARFRLSRASWLNALGVDTNYLLERNLVRA